MLKDNLCLLALFLALVCLVLEGQGQGVFSWMKPDNFNVVNKQVTKTTKHNCRAMSKEQLTLPEFTVSQIPKQNELLSKIWYANRTSLVHLHNMALNRAYFYSYILQRMNLTENFDQQPNWMYLYFSAAADVNANPHMLNASAVYFDTDMYYPNWYINLAFNRTIPLFGPKAFRWDNWNDQSNFLREPNRRSVRVEDVGSGTNRNYTNRKYRMNPWYSTYLPDSDGYQDSRTKFTYYVGFKKAKSPGVFLTKSFRAFNFFGPNSPGANVKDPQFLPVQFTRGYFDCGKSNQWVVSAVSPVVDYWPRYSNWTHLRRQRFVAVVSMDIYFKEIDFNPCGISKGNPGPSFLSGIDRCKPTTGCKHVGGRGFKRAVYKCTCKKSHRYPYWLRGPYYAKDIEQATAKEYKEGFVCLRIHRRLVQANVIQTKPVDIDDTGTAPVTNVLEKRSVDEEEPPDDLDMFELSQDPETIRRIRVLEDLEDDDEGDQEDSPMFSDPKIKLTPQQVMDLADKIERMEPRVSNTSIDSLAKARARQREVEEEHAWNNDVNFDLEKQYEKDVKTHDELYQSLRETGTSMNVTHTIHTLYDSLMQVRDKHAGRVEYERTSTLAKKRRKRAAAFDQRAHNRMMRILRQKASVTPETCRTMAKNVLELPGDTGYGADFQFQAEGRTALRLTNFLSAYLQNTGPYDNFGNIRGGGLLYEDQMFGEVLANVMGNYRIYSAGVYFDKDKFENQDGTHRPLFGPWAYKKKGGYYVIDTAGYNTSYAQTEWFQRARRRFLANFQGLVEYKTRTYIRSDMNGTSSIKTEFFPMTYKAAPYDSGFWTNPHFRCDGIVNVWVMTYVTPFFGLDKFKTKLEFRGVATVDVPLDFLEIYQCPQSYFVANAFKNTARCDFRSTKCTRLYGFMFQRGSYKCKCREGYEFWHNDGRKWFSGYFMEMEWAKKLMGVFNRFDQMNCRISSGTNVQLSIGLIAAALFTCMYRQFSLLNSSS